MAPFLEFLVMIMMMVPICGALRCPSSCSFISPIPYPFGAAPGCGSPAFQISNCSVSPQWDLQLSDTQYTYYISSNSSLHSSSQSYGYGGFIVVSLTPNGSTPVCNTNAPFFSPTSFSSSNLYAFEAANLTFYQDKYLLLNCTAQTSEEPDSGVFTPSSRSCAKYVQHCNFSSSGQCLEYAPVKDLYLGTLMSTYSCTSFRRFIIENDDDPVEAWVAGTKFAWGPVKDAATCTRCQDTGGVCGYNTQDNSFLCYCGDDTYETDCGGTHSGSNTALIVGISCAAVFLLASSIIAFIFYHKHYYWRLFGNRKHYKLEQINEASVDFPYGALAAATRNFSLEIGRGGFGKVYKGLLPDGNEIAVKVLDASMSHSDVQFLNEVATIGNIHHMNVARLFGFCFKKSKRMLVYEYVSNGSLDKHLFTSEKAALNWEQRFHIALGVARGLSYMHEECRNCIIHCDIKPQNILLDASYCPKIADFGLARLLTREESRVLTQARGTPGYVAPEFWSLGSGPLTAKFDVYSYGVLLLELVRGKRHFHQCDPFALEESAEGMKEWMSVYVDDKIVHDADPKQAQLCTLVAMWCIQEDPALRPTMSRVVQYLLGLGIVPENPPSPFKKMWREEGSETEQTSAFSSST